MIINLASIVDLVGYSLGVWVMGFTAAYTFRTFQKAVEIT